MSYRLLHKKYIMRKQLTPLTKYVILLGMALCYNPSVGSFEPNLSTSIEEPTKEYRATPVPDFYETTESDSLDIILGIKDHWVGDFDGMLLRRKIRVLVPYNKNFFFLDGNKGNGLTHEAMEIFEKYLLRTTGTRVSTVIIPVRRDQLFKALEEGVGDVAAAYLTITPEREKKVDFTTPVYRGAKEWVVTGPGTPTIKNLADLSGQDIYVRKSSSFYEHLMELNDSFLKEGLPIVQVHSVDEYLEDEDVLQLVNAGFLPATVVEDNIGRFWSKQFSDIQLRSDLPIDSDGQIAWAIRKGSPLFKEVLDSFIKEHRKGTLLGNVLFNRYLKSHRFINSITDKELERFNTTVAYFKKYATKYDLDWLITIAQGYQESRLNQSARSHVGAVGIMQLRPSTASDRNVNIPNIYDLENNIHAGIKYSRFILDHYFNDPNMDELNKHLFVLASYNAGPNRIASMRRLARQRGLDPNVWFNNVERIAAEKIGREPVQYVSNVYKYYLSLYFINQFLERKADETKP